MPMQRAFFIRWALLLCWVVGAARAEDRDPRFAPKPIESYREILAVLPEGLRTPRAASKWTAVQREAVNKQLHAAFEGKKTRVKMRLRVSEVANWGGMRLYSEITSKDGCHVRVFGKFTDSWKPKLAELKKNHEVTLEGILESADYCDLWGEFTLSIIVANASFERPSGT